MMRYQRVSPDISQFSFTSDDPSADNSGAPIGVLGCAAIGGDVLFQWNRRKRSRGSRSDGRIAPLSSSAGDESLLQKRPGKIPRRSAILAAEKAAAAAMAMPPPRCGGGLYRRGSNLRSSLPAQLNSRVLEDRSVSPTRSDKRSPPSPLEKFQKMLGNGGSATEFTMNTDSKQQPSDQETGGAAAEKLNLDHLEWPRVYISLSRKEKEDDFLAMKGTKLPQRPKKRAKNIDRTLQYCFPGMWLVDLTRSRYEVREKKCVKKKRRGLKGMESMDSDSE